MAAVAHAATLEARVPFLHFFDGFRTSHELNEVALLDDDELHALVDDELVRAHRRRALDPDRPVIRGTAQNPDVFFQAREASNAFHLLVPRIVQATFDRLAASTGRQYRLFEYTGHPEAERVVVVMGSARTAAVAAAEARNRAGERVGVVQVRLFRPFDLDALREPLSPESIARARAAGTTLNPAGRNPGDVWSIPTAPYPEAHFATMPPELAERCAEVRSDFRDAGPAMATRVGAFDAEIHEVVCVDYSAVLGAPAPTWVAAGRFTVVPRG